MTTLSLSERAIAQVVSLLSSITVANGYRTDAGKRVFRALRTIDPKQLPCIDLWEGRESVDNGTGVQNMNVTLELSIEGHCTANQSNTGQMLGWLKADIKKALCVGNGGLPDPPNRPFARVNYLSSDPNPRPDSANSENVIVTFSLAYCETFGDPYTA